MTAQKSDLWHKILTIAITVMIVVIGYLANTINQLSNQQQRNTVALAVLSESVLTHNLNAGKYIEQIEDHEKRIMVIEQLHINNSMTKDEVLEAIDNLKEWVDKNYQRK